MAASFTQQLRQARRTARLAGRPVTREEAAGIAEGVAEGADVRLSRGRQLDLQEEQLGQQESQFSRRLETERETRDLELAAADRAQVAQERQGQTSGAIGGALIGFQLGGPLGAAVGAITGFFAGGSWLCTAAEAHSHMHQQDKDAMAVLKSYSRRNHKQMLLWYLREGPKLTEAIFQQEKKSINKFYILLKLKMLTPIVHRVLEHKLEEAYLMYREYTYNLVKKYTPEMVEDFESIMENDTIKEAA